MLLSQVAQIIPLTVFEKFCSGSLLYSPPIDSTPLILQSSLPSSLYPFLLIGVCLFDDKDILQEIGEGKFVASTVTSPAVTVNGNEDVIVPALFYASAVSIYSNKVCHYEVVMFILTIFYVCVGQCSSLCVPVVCETVIR